MNYDTWTKQDLIAEIAALNANIDKRVEKRLKPLRDREIKQHQSNAKDREGLIEAARAHLNQLLEDASKDLLKTAETLAMQRASLYHRLCHRFSPYEKLQRDMVDSLNLSISYHYHELKKALGKNHE